eukprot:scaffold8.g1551.t1
MTYTPGPPTASLLFTPASHARDKAEGGKATPSEFRSLASFGRSPGAQHRGFAGSGRKETPTRRRSLTPASQPKDTPPPPPMESLLDSPMGPGMGPWGTPPPEDGVEDMVTSASPLVGAAPQQQQQQAAQQLELARAIDLQQFEDTVGICFGFAAIPHGFATADMPLPHAIQWVTVFGFRSQSDLPLVLKEFSKCGDIRQFGSFGDSPSVNWVHIQYASKYGAQRALLRSGDQLSQSVMVGVKPLDAAHRAAVERVVGGAAPASLALSFPKPAAVAAQRPYAISGGAAPVVPLPAKGFGAKLAEFILGV